MRLGPGKHLKGRVLIGGVVKPEEFDYFHEVRDALQVKFLCSNTSTSLSSMPNYRVLAVEQSLTVF